MKKQLESAQHDLQEQKLKNKLKIPTTTENSPSSTSKLRLRHIAQSFAFCQNLWLNVPPDVISNTQLPPDYNPATRFQQDAIRDDTTALYDMVYELQEHLGEKDKETRTSKVLMNQVIVTHI